ncbi:hypothetical protein SAMN04488128_10353 [Chitinophaga eiseniae]|uniref:DUF6630 domain-containing protein n=1 Tax=Chitinophaga eiseniae TaxID=634771 RepID=A0A1T4SLF8_9BACT|nr:hypothetical protein [Chitinophaga eiseniae]SKA29049.1 hypothetical protein SAMN04488128_10353 [Chitinophaga eiseniae]
MNANFLRYLLLPEEEKQLTAAQDDEQLLAALLKHRYLLMIDWKGEEEPGTTGDFLKARAAALKPGFDLDTASVYEALQEEAAGFEPGDSVPFLLKSFRQLLKKEALVIVELDRGDDNYYISLTTDKKAKDLKKQSTGFWTWRPAGQGTGEVLYTVYCTCGAMNVWQVKRGEVITEGACDDCNREIFDKDGKSSLPVLRDYI